MNNKNTNESDVVSLEDILIFFIKNFKIFILIGLFLFLVSSTFLLYFHKQSNNIYIAIDPPMSTEKVADNLSFHDLKDILNLKELIVWQLIPNYINSLTDQREKKLISNLKFEASFPVESNSKISNDKLLILKTQTKDQTSDLDIILKNFTSYLANHLSNKIMEIISVIDKRHAYEEFNYIFSKRLVDERAQSEVENLSKQYEINVEKIKESLKSSKMLEGELERQIAKIESNGIKLENHGYLLLKQNFLYEQLYVLNQKRFQEQNSLKYMQEDLQFNINKINNQKRLSLLEIKAQKDIKLKQYELRKDSLVKASLSYFVSHDKKGLSVFALLGLSFMLSLLISALSTFLLVQIKKLRIRVKN